MFLVFVYNAKSDKVSALIDYAHKVISPSTYNCNLCKLTHSNLGERKEWVNFTKNLDVEIQFYHIDEFESKFNRSYEYPIILKNSNNEFEVLINHKAIEEIKDVSDLTKKITELL